MPRADLRAASAALAAGAGRRLAAASARAAAADDMLALADGRAPARRPPPLAGREFDPAPGFVRALCGWLLAWPLDALSRIRLAIARSVVRTRGAARRERPGARSRDGPR